MKRVINPCRPLVAMAVAIGSWTSRHRIVASLAVFAILAAVGGGTWGVLARQDPMPTGGTSAPGSHQFYDSGDAENSFCNACHNAIRSELEASATGEKHYQEECLYCHGPGTGEHAAASAMCADCHSGGGGGDCHSCHSDCSLCHQGPGPGGFSVLAPAQAHAGNDAAELANDAHASFYATVGETEGTASWVCKACHTAVEVDLQVTQNPALPLELGPTYAPPTP